MTHARLLAGARHGRDLPAVGEDQALGLIGDLVDTLAARLAVVLGHRGHSVEPSPVRRHACSTAGGWPQPDRSLALLTTLETADRAVSLALRLTWLGAEHERSAAGCDTAVAALL